MKYYPLSIDQQESDINTQWLRQIIILNSVCSVKGLYRLWAHRKEFKYINSFNVPCSIFIMRLVKMIHNISKYLHLEIPVLKSVHNKPIQI